MSHPLKTAMILKSDFKQEPTVNYMLLFHAGVHIQYVLYREVKNTGSVSGDGQNTSPATSGRSDLPSDTAAPESCDKSSVQLPVSKLPSQDGPGLGRWEECRELTESLGKRLVPLRKAAEHGFGACGRTRPQRDQESTCSNLSESRKGLAGDFGVSINSFLSFLPLCL